MNHVLLTAGKGLAAGALATICMSILMLASKRLGIQGEHPPKRITQAALKSAGASPASSRKVNLLSSLAHVGFGAGSGALYALANLKARPGKLSSGRGMLFAFVIWLVSYRGWVPALRIMPSAKHDRPGRVWTMIAAHLVYGATLNKLLGLRVQNPGQREPQPSFAPIDQGSRRAR